MLDFSTGHRLANWNPGFTDWTSRPSFLNSRVSHWGLQQMPSLLPPPTLPFCTPPSCLPESSSYKTNAPIALILSQGLPNLLFWEIQCCPSFFTINFCRLVMFSLFNNFLNFSYHSTYYSYRVSYSLYYYLSATSSYSWYLSCNVSYGLITKKVLVEI